jgi:transposase
LYSDREIALLEKVSELEKLLSEKKAEVSRSHEEIAEKKALIAYLQRMVYGQKREKFITPPEGQLPLPFEIDDQAQKQIQELVAAKKQEIEEKEQQPKERKPHPGRNQLPKHLEIKETIIEPEGDLSEMVHVGDEVSQELEYQPAKYYIHRIIRRKYAPKSGEGSFMTATLPDRVIDKGIPGAGVIAQAIIDKYIDHLPVYRQIGRFARDGIEISEATLHHWVKRGAQKLEILYDYLWEQQLRCGYLQVDETTIKVLQSEKKKKAHLGYYWVYHDPIGKTAMFRYESGRAGAFPVKQLASFKGYLQTDGYAGYNQLAKKEQITHLSCWAHVRREFEKALQNDKNRAEIALTLIQSLYAIEKQGRELHVNERKELRLEKSLPIINAFFKWVAGELYKTLPKSQIGKALAYAKDRYDSLMAYLYDGNLIIDNNLVENAIRPVALGRKNYLFAKTHESAQRAAIIYTFMAICKKHQVNPFNWLKSTLLKIDSTSIQKLDTLLPQNFDSTNM